MEMPSCITLEVPVFREERCSSIPQRVDSESVDQRHGLIVWFTGLSSAGKTTIGDGVERALRQRGEKVELLDGDVMRRHLCPRTGFSRAERDENVRRIAFVADLLARNGVTVLVSAIAPYRSTRDEIRQKTRYFLEVYVNAPLDVCESRDVKGLYRLARSGRIQNFTGLDDPYEPPLQADLECRTNEQTVLDSVTSVVTFLDQYRRNHRAG